MSMLIVSYSMTKAPQSQAPLRKTSMEDAKGIIKAELKRRGMTYADLVTRLAAHGVAESEANLRNKISRGSFTAAFFLQCLIAIGCEHVVIRPPSPPKPD